MAPSLPASNPSAEVRGRWYDRLGAATATLCAVHCALLPLAMAFLPALGLEFLASHAFEGFFLAFTVVFASLSVGHSLRAHGRFFAWPLLVVGLAILFAERFVPAIHDHALLHALTMTTAGTLVAAAHLLNLRLAHRKGRTTACEGHRHAHDEAPGATLPPLSDQPHKNSGVSHG
ncbi:MerC domain-containing protein [Silanimonas algicola]